MRQDQPFIWKSSLGGPIVAWGRVSGDLQGRSNSVSQVVGISDMAPACQLCSSVPGGEGGWFSKGTMASAHLDARHLSFSQYVTVPYKLLPQCWSSEGVSLGG